MSSLCMVCTECFTTALRRDSCCCFWQCLSKSRLSFRHWYKHQHHHLLFNNGRFPGEPGLACFLLVLILHHFWKRTSGNNWHRFLPARCPKCHSTNSVGAVKEREKLWPKRSKSPNNLVLSSSTGLLGEETLLPPRPISDVSTHMNGTCQQSWRHQKLKSTWRPSLINR